jgi:outer membrane protein assembly factor BamB
MVAVGRGRIISAGMPSVPIGTGTIRSRLVAIGTRAFQRKNMIDQDSPGAIAGGVPDQRTTPAKVSQLRVWPGMLLVAAIVMARYIPPLLEGGNSRYWMISVFGPLLCCLLVMVWWLSASRATWRERVFGGIALIAAMAITALLVDRSMRGPGITYLTLPMGMMAFVAGAMLLRSRQPAFRTTYSVALAAVGLGFSLLLRSDGMTGGYDMDLHWRWSATAEARMLDARPTGALAPDQHQEAGALATALAHPEWPGFRGPGRAAHARDPGIMLTWSDDPPRQLWKIPVGPGWSSFAVAGNALFTQEQRGPMEAVVCYAADTGRELWSRQIEARFEDSMGGPGPRATPTLAEGGLYATGAAGDLLRLDPVTGSIVWRQSLTTIAGRAAPMWGFSASPLVAAATVIVQAGGPGKGSCGLLGFDAASGTLRWSVADGNDSYSSPQLNTIANEDVVLMLTNDGLLLADPASGGARLSYAWKFPNYRALQPCFIGDDTILLPSGMGAGTRAIRIARNGGTLAATELWTSRNLSPDFTDLVAFKGHAYGNDGGIFTCIDLATGARCWKGGRYGKGQVLLLEDSGLLLIAAEDGRAVLLAADPAEHRELCSFQALEGKTWNHPVLVGDKLYLRNAQEAACYQLRLSERKRQARASGPEDHVWTTASGP